MMMSAVLDTFQRLWEMFTLPGTERFFFKKQHKVLLQMNIKVKELSKQAKDIYFVYIIFIFIISFHLTIASVYL